MDVTVRRALVRSVARFDYAGVQAGVDAGVVHPSIAALPEFGRLREAAARARGAIELRLPEQDVIADGNGWRLTTQPRTEVDDWNSHVSLLTGMCAAQMMLDARIGLLRTLPAAAPEAVTQLRRTASALGVPWPADVPVGSFLAGLDMTVPGTLVLMSEAPRAAARRVVRRVRRRGAGAAGARGDRSAVRTRHGAAAAVGRPVRDGGVPGGLCRHRRAGIRARGAPGASRDHDRFRCARREGDPRVHRTHRGDGPRPARGGRRSMRRSCARRTAAGTPRCSCPTPP